METDKQRRVLSVCPALVIASTKTNFQKCQRGNKAKHIISFVFVFLVCCNNNPTLDSSQFIAYFTGKFVQHE